MRALVYESFAGPMTVREEPAPAAPRAGVVIRVGASGICRSDWHGWQGHDPDIALPHVPGHELAGTIESVGPDVRGWQVGARVTVPFVCGCGRCDRCAAGDQQVCEHQTQPGFTHWGSFAEQVAVEAADVNLVALPDELSFAVAASLGCRYGTAFRAVVHQGRVRPGEWVAVHGCGGVGLSAVMIAAASGARVVAVDVSAGALELAAAFGADVCVDATALAGSPARAVREATGGGAHVSVDALGSPATCAASILGLRRHGRHVQVGLLPDNPEVPMSRVIAYELSVLGSHGMAAHDYPAMLAMIAAGRLHPDRLVTTTITLDQVPAALTAMDSARGPGVTVIEPHG
jgi:D-arabinose 1-dehydrogenase-like Zn-dependent alcohol dehydrogenase